MDRPCSSDVDVTNAVWLTDLHFNFVAEPDRRAFLDALAARAPSLVLVGGDMGEAGTFDRYLIEVADAVAAPVYFVLGNHDYFKGTIAEVRRTARELSRHRPSLVWLPDAGVVPLGPATALVGHGGWGDARAGDFAASDVVLNDYLLIGELRDCLDRRALARRSAVAPGDILCDALREKLEQLGDEAAAHLRRSAQAALDWAKELVVLMHVPPFREACWHQGRTSDDNWAPHFVCAAAGEVLLDVMRNRPACRATVLCGHTHSPGRAALLPNLTVLTGGAEYGRPAIQTAWPPPASTDDESPGFMA